MHTNPTPKTVSNAAIRACRYLDDPANLYERSVCLYPVSKNLRGELHLCLADTKDCTEPDCTTFKSDHLLRLEVGSADCDGIASECLNQPPGTWAFLARNMVHALITDGQGRGPHTADFVWKGDCMVVVGEMSGMTNIGTHRPPAFGNCQTCDDQGVLEGRLLGRVVQADDERLVGCCLTAVYRLCFDPSEDFRDTAVTGTLEGVIVCSCE